MQNSFITNDADFAHIQYYMKNSPITHYAITLILNTRYNFITDYADYADFRGYSTKK